MLSCSFVGEEEKARGNSKGQVSNLKLMPLEESSSQWRTMKQRKIILEDLVTSRAMKSWQGCIYETPEEKDGYKACMKIYLAKLNPKCDALFQYPKKHWKYDDELCYDARPIGVKKLDGMMKGCRTVESVHKPQRQGHRNHLEVKHRRPKWHIREFKIEHYGWMTTVGRAREVWFLSMVDWIEYEPFGAKKKRLRL